MSSPDEPRVPAAPTVPPEPAPEPDTRPDPVVPDPLLDPVVPDPVVPDPVLDPVVPDPVVPDPVDAPYAATPVPITATPVPLPTAVSLAKPPAPATALGEPADGDPPPTGEPAGSAARRPTPVLLVALLVVVLLAAAAAFLGLRVRSEARSETARLEAVAASRDAARLLFSYNYNSLDADFAKGLAVTTGQFREEYRRTTKDVVTGVAKQYKAVVLADVVESAVVEASPDLVTTIVFLNQATTSTRVQGQQVDASRVRMVLEQRDGRWLVSKVEAL